jgi:hypothetical protein
MSHNVCLLSYKTPVCVKRFFRDFGGFFPRLIQKRLAAALETRRAVEDGVEFKPIRRGWFVGDKLSARSAVVLVHRPPPALSAKRPEQGSSIL